MSKRTSHIRLTGGGHRHRGGAYHVIILLAFATGFYALLGSKEIHQGERADAGNKNPQQQQTQPARDDAVSKLLFAGQDSPQPPPTENAESTASILSDVIPVSYGDNLYDTLSVAGLNDAPARHIVNALRGVVHPRQLHMVSHLKIFYRYGDVNERPRPHRIDLDLDNGRRFSVHRKGDGSYLTRAAKASGFTLTFKREGTVQDGLNKSLRNAGIPDAVINETFAALSYEVDIQREIRNGDRFRVMYELTRNAEHHATKGARLLTFSFVHDGGRKTLDIYRFSENGDHLPFYKADGESVAKALLRTPLNGARLSSGFGQRRHPILGYTRMHHGVDFAAPEGTPVFAAGDGVIERMMHRGNYGNYLLLTHNSAFATAYAHLRNFAEDVWPGKHVRQGEIIGYVGSSGLSTGPHLHYEIYRHRKAINPQSLKLPGAYHLRGRALAHFKSLLRDYDAWYANLPHWQLAARPE